MFRTPKQQRPLDDQLWCIYRNRGKSIQAVRRRPSLINPEVLVARFTRVDTSRSRHAAVISASFSFSAGESSTTGVARRCGRLVELTERDTERDEFLEAITVPASRFRGRTIATSATGMLMPCGMWSPGGWPNTCSLQHDDGVCQARAPGSREGRATSFPLPLAFFAFA
jgi:hypothetical protein